MEQIRRTLESQDVRCVKLDLPFAFHIAQMDVILDRFEKLASHVSFKAPSIPIVSPLLGDCVFDGKSVDAGYLRRATREPVNFTEAIAAAQGLGIIDDKTMWLEIGPHPICSGFLRNIMGPGTQALSSFRRHEDNFITLSKTLSALYLVGVPISWQEYFKPHEPGHELLHLEKYGWNEKNYWIDYVGTWTLDKAHLKANGGKLPGTGAPIAKNSALRTSSIHQITAEEVQQGSRGKLTTVSDMQHPDFLAAVHGHRMNNCGVATSVSLPIHAARKKNDSGEAWPSVQLDNIRCADTASQQSIWADMAFTVGEYLYKRVSPVTKQVHMNLADMVVLHAQVAKKAKGATQLLLLEAELDLAAQHMSLSWSNATDDGQKATTGGPFATGTIRFEDPAAWRRE